LCGSCASSALTGTVTVLGVAGVIGTLLVCPTSESLRAHTTAVYNHSMVRCHCRADGWVEGVPCRKIAWLEDVKACEGVFIAS
jgi:hypothetical protein